VVLKREYRPGRRCRSVLVRYGEDEFAVVSAAAARAGLAPTSYVAEAALAAAGGADPPSTAPLHAVAVELMQARLEVRRVGVALSRAVTAVQVTGVAPSSLADLVRRCGDAVARVDAAAAELGRVLR
jgi:GGDEF domain-containing protein